MSIKRGGIAGRKRRTQIEGQWIAYTLDMITSPAWQALSLNGRKILNRLEIEHCKHGGAENGKLPCTYNDFQRYGVRRGGINPALIEATALGFVATISFGKRAYGDIPGRPSTYRLTYLPAHDGPATHEWRKIESPEAAVAAITKAKTDYETFLNTSGMSARLTAQKTKAQCQKRSIPVSKVALQ